MARRDYPQNMDPDRFQMKDLKRRLAKLETAHKRLLARYERMILARIRIDASQLALNDEIQNHLR